MFYHECDRRFLSYHNFCSYCGADLKEEKKTYSEEYDQFKAQFEKLTWEQVESHLYSLRNIRKTKKRGTVEDWNLLF